MISPNPSRYRGIRGVNAHHQPETGVKILSQERNMDKNKYWVTQQLLEKQWHAMHTLRKFAPVFLSWHSVTASLYSGIIWARAWCFTFNFPLCPSSMNTKQLDFCQQWWHTSSFINNWEYQLPMNKSSKETWIFKLFLFSLVFFPDFSLSPALFLSWSPYFLSGKTKCVHTPSFFCFLFSVSMLTCKIIKNSEKAEAILTGTDLDHTWEHTEKWCHTQFQVYFEFIALSQESPLHLQLKAAEKGSHCVHVVNALQCMPSLLPMSDKNLSETKLKWKHNKTLIQCMLKRTGMKFFRSWERI